MVKRPKSPETNEDERYFIVYQPYPLNANWEVPDDYILFSRWIAACIGTDPLHALHYKPSARSMVIIEVDKKYSFHERLLGEHRWKDFLKEPGKDEVDRVSQIFYCLYNTGREAQKDGWKRIHVETPWFKGWEPGKNFKDPYPATHWCPTPPEDRTNKSLCRPLPVKDKPPSAKSVPLVVGSESWAQAKTDPSSTRTQQAAKQAKKNGKAKQTVNTSNVASGAADTSSRSQTSANTGWNKPILQSTTAPVQSESSSAVSPVSSPASPPNAWAKPPALRNPASTRTEPPVIPPGLSIRRTPGQNIAAPPGLTKPSISTGTSDSAGSSSASGSSWEGNGADPTKSLDTLFNENVVIRVPQETTTTSDALWMMGDDGSGDEEDVVNPWEGNNMAYVGDEHGVAPASGNVNAPVDLWGDQTGLAQKPTVAKCPYHAHLCKKGVCEWRAKQVKEEERLAKLGKAIDEGSKNTRGRGRGARRQSHGAQSNQAESDGFSAVRGRNSWRRR